MNIRESLLLLIESEIIGFFVDYGIESPTVTLDRPADFKHGDISINAALKYAKKLGKDPYVLAQDISGRISKKQLQHIEKIEVVKPGFINIFFDVYYFSEIIKKIAIESSSYGNNRNFINQKVIIEYTNCNVLKPMHIGHLMGNIIGESISRIIKSAGAEVKNNNYQGDSGLHIAKAIWGIIKMGGEKNGESLSEKTEYIGNAYALGANSYEDDENAQKEIKELNQKIFKKSDETLNSLYNWGRQVSLDHFEVLYKKLGTKFDYYFFESEITDSALKIIMEFMDKGIFEQSEGAIVFKGEKFDPKLHTRVFINNHGIPTYEAKDIAHAIRKYEIYKFDKCIIVTANEQSDYFKVVLRALREINPEIASKTQHITHGLLKFLSGKMSSRKGNAITGESLINDVRTLVREKMKDREFSKDEKNEIAEIVAIGAIKYSILRQAIGGDIIFDFNRSISLEGDSGPYLQYATVRANSLLKKAEGVVELPEKVISDWETINLERLLERFPEVVERAGKEYAPHYITTYLTELAGSFNNFYAHEQIIEDSPESPYRLAIAKAFNIVMKNGLTILGIPAPERM